MEERKFRTLVVRGVNEYIRGRISGFQEVICVGFNKIGYANSKCDEGTIMTVKCSSEKYYLFAAIVERYYPGLCTFDYK